MQTDFPIAIHMLILVSESDEPMSSERIAGSVGVNASRIRKIASQLRNAELVDSHRGLTGFTLRRDPKDITLLQIYDAVSAGSPGGIFSIHKNPNDSCLVGRYIQPTLGDAFSAIEAETMRSLNEMTLADIIDDMRSRARTDGALRSSEESS